MLSSPELPGSSSSTWSAAYRAIAAGLIILATILAYAPALRGGFLWDDDAHVTKPELRTLFGLYRIWFDVGATQQYYPLLHSAFWFEHKLWGDSPIGYHVVNIALHVGAALLVMAIVRRLLASRGIPWADAAAALTAAVFALHPVHVESVAWVTEQKNTLSAVFYLASLLVYLRFDTTRRRGEYLLAATLFLLALLSKPVTVTLPAALLVILWWQHGRLAWRRDIGPLLPWFVLSMASGLFAAWVEHDVIGAQGEAFSVSGWQRLVLPGRAVGFYLQKLLWPRELIFVYPRWHLDAGVWRQWLFSLGLVLVVAVLLVASRRWRGPLAALLFYAGTLFPVLGFFNVYLFQYTFVADHFQYLASLGIITLVCCLLVQITAKSVGSRGRAVVLAALPIGLAVLTCKQAAMYGDIETLYETTIAKNPACWMAYNNLGVVLHDHGKDLEAIEKYHLALDLRPGYPEAHNNLGVAMNKIGRHDAAVAAYEQALRYRPVYPDAHANLVAALTDARRPLAAIERGQAGILLNPNDARLRVSLGIALRMERRHLEALDQFEQALRIRPDFVEALGNLGATYEALGRMDEAVATGERALQLARAHGDAGLADMLDAWLQSCRARNGGSVTQP